MLRLSRCARIKVTPKRHVSSLVNISPEVKSAVASGTPVVALESTIYTHGMPFPRNLQVALSVEAIVRKHGAIPATIGCLNGNFYVGMTAGEIEALTKTAHAAKISRRDFAVVAARGLSGGTTIAGTMVLAHMAGIKVFATGGLGGVHRRGESTMDISADLDELGRTPVAVICSGAKAILDLPRTLEYLETKGVTVTTMGGDGVEIPAFYSRESGVKSPFNSSSIEDAAKLIHANRSLGLDSGIAIMNPIPQEYSIPQKEMEVVIEEAVRECNRLGIVGKDITPFLLQRVVEATHGRSLTANIGLIEDNVRVGTEIALSLAALENRSSVPPPNWNAPAPVEEYSPVDILVIGSMAVDLTCTMHSGLRNTMEMQTSHPAKIHTTAGGVAHNIALSTSYASSCSVRLVTSLGTDPEGAWLRDYAQNVGLDVALISGDAETARYVAIHDKKGELVLAAADMNIIESFKKEDIQREIRRAKASFVAFDGNISPATIKTILEECGPETRGNIYNSISLSVVLFEPTSVPKAAAIFQNPVELGIFPKHSISMITPNVFELKAMFNAGQKNGHFEGPEWWSVLDSFKLTSQFRQDVEFLLRKVSRQHKHGSLDDPIEFEYNTEHHKVQNENELKLGRDLMGEGALQQAVALLPYIPNIFIKLGSLGVLGVRLCPKETEIMETDATTLRFPGVYADVVVQHHRGLPHRGIVSVTGAGDTFSGVLIAQLAGGYTIDEAVDMAQKAAILTLASPLAVSEQIRQLKM